MSGDIIGRLRGRLAALPEPWVVLANRRASGADGPPWVRYVVLHPGKGIVLVDTDRAEPAVAPLEDFLWHTGFAALQGGALPIVAVTVAADASDVVTERIEAAFAGSQCGLANAGWCEAVVDLLLAMPDLMLARLRRAVPAATSPALWGDGPVQARHAASPPATRLSASAQGRWLEIPELARPKSTWRSWPTSPVTVAMVLLALGAVALVSRQTSSPVREPVKPPLAAALAATMLSDNDAPAAAAQAQPSSSDIAAVPPPPVAKPASIASAPPAAAKRTAPPRQTTEHHVRRPVVPSQSVARAPQMAAIGRVPVCADVLHPELPGGWEYHGPPVSGCLPIRFFGMIGMR
ncbi:MAG: hypothetical protein ACREEL_12770 [Stellaceae bacterium]